MSSTTKIENSIECVCQASPLTRNMWGQWHHEAQGCNEPEVDFDLMAAKIVDAVGDDDHATAAVLALALAMAEEADDEEAAARAHIDDAAKAVAAFRADAVRLAQAA